MSFGKMDITYIIMRINQSLTQSANVFQKQFGKHVIVDIGHGLCRLLDCHKLNSGSCIRKYISAISSLAYKKDLLNCSNEQYMLAAGLSMGGRWNSGCNKSTMVKWPMNCASSVNRIFNTKGTKVPSLTRDQIVSTWLTCFMHWLIPLDIMIASTSCY